MTPDEMFNVVYNLCYTKIASKRKWQNRDFDEKFDGEVTALYAKVYNLLVV